MKAIKMDIPSTAGAQAAKGLQLTDSKGQEPEESGFLGLFSSLQTTTQEAENQAAEIAIDVETGKPLPEDGEVLPDFIQVNVLEVAESDTVAITGGPLLTVGEVPVISDNQPDAVMPVPVPVANTPDEQMAAVVKGSVLPVFSNAIPLENPVEESVVTTAAKNTEFTIKQIPEITAAYLKEGQTLVAKKELPAVKFPSQLTHSNIATQISEGDLDPRLLGVTNRQPLKPEIDTPLAEEPVIAEKKVEPFQALRMANARVAIESGSFSESLAANAVNTETRTASGTGSLLRSEQTAFSPEPQAPLTLSLRQTNWSQSLSSNVLWMVKEDLQTATIRVKPAELGPLNIQVSVQQEQLNVSISANQAVTREMLEAALPKLREQFIAQGFSQVNVDISDQGKSQSGQQELAENNSRETPVFSSVEEAHDQEENISLLQQSIHNSLLDTFA